MKLVVPFSRLETLEKRHDSLAYRAIREWYLSPQRFIRSSTRFLDNKISTIINESENQLYRLNFKIPPRIIHNAENIRITGECEQSPSTLWINPYRGNTTHKIKSEDFNLKIESELLEQGHNVIICNEKVSIENFEFYLNSQSGSVFINTPSINSNSAYTNAAMEFILNSQVTIPERSPLTGSYYGQYDYTNDCHRKPHWLWSDATVVPVVLDLMGADGEVLAQQLYEVFINHQIREEGIDGGLVSRFRYYGNPEYPYECLIGPNDTSYIVRWALLPFYQYTGRESVLERARQSLSWVISVIKNKEFVPSHYYLERKRWEEGAFVDSGFLPIGFYQYSKIADLPNGWIPEVNRFMSGFIDRFKLSSGYFKQNHNTDKQKDEKIFARGQGWVLAGLIATHGLTAKRDYLTEAIELGKLLADSQNEDGSWSYLLGYGKEKSKVKASSGSCEKSTSVLIYYLNQLDLMQEEIDLSKSVNRGTRWCENNLELDPGPGYGGISSENLYSGIVGKPFIKMATGYANCYYIMTKEGLHW